MSDSDAAPASPLPPDAKIEHALRAVVRDLWAAGNPDELTVKRVRKAAEQRLRLPADFLKNDAAWKDRSKAVITDEVSVQERGEEDVAKEREPAVPAKPAKPQRKAVAAKSASAAQKRKTTDTAKPTKKQTAATRPKGRKRQKISVSSDEEDASDEVLRSDASESSEPSSKKRRRKPQVVEDASEGEDEQPPAAIVERSQEKSTPSGNPEAGDADDDDAQRKSESPVRETKAADSDSEMSVLIDEPPKKKRQKKAPARNEKPTKPASSKIKAKDDKDLDPQEAEIKRLQGWLVKCGIRKLWGKELKPFDTTKAKVNHLKEMLKDAGMEGRYSVEKARQIKERRELAADLEAVQEGAKRWGQSGSEDEGESTGRPRRRLAKGLKDLEGLIDSEGGESD